MKNIVSKYREQAKRLQKRIVFPEGEEERIINAAGFLKKENIVEPMLVGSADKITEKAGKLNIDITGITIIDPEKHEKLDSWIDMYYQLRKHKGVSIEQAGEILKNPLYVGGFLLRDGMADGAVAGSINATGDVIRAGIQVVGLAPGVSVVSSS
jgi:phosphate acetyltransferase